MLTCLLIKTQYCVLFQGAIKFWCFHQSGMCASRCLPVLLASESVSCDRNRHGSNKVQFEHLKWVAGARSQAPPLGSICQAIINQHSQMLLSGNLLTFPQKAF